MACNPTAFVLGGTSTIDSGTDTSQLLLKLRGALFKNTPQHGNTGEAFKNCLKASGQVNIIGWGQQAVIYTGAGGPPAATTDQMISAGNFATWHKSYPNTAAGHSMTALTLCSCDTAAGTDGASLLREIAKLVGVPVTAPTGLVYYDEKCDELFLETGARWLTATPKHTPDAVDQPRPYKAAELKRYIKLMDPVFETRLVETVEFKALDADLLHPMPVWSGADVAQPLSFVNSLVPSRGGLAMACVTGHVTLTFRRGMSSVTRVFRILNERLLQDTEHEEVYYYFNSTELIDDVNLGH